MNIIERTFMAAEVAELTGASPKDVQNWAARGVMVGHRVEGGGSKGKARRFSFFNVMEIAVAKAILDAGSRNVEAAFKAAAGFSHAGDGGSGWEGDDTPPSPHRLPGLPWHHDHDDTRLFVNGGASFAVADGIIGHSEHRALIYLGRPPAYLVVNVSQVFGLICQRAGLDARVVLDAVYASEEGTD